MLTRKLPLAAFLAATLVAASSHACGPFFPNYLLADRQANLLYLPEELCFREQPPGACRSATSAMA